MTGRTLDPDDLLADVVSGTLAGIWHVTYFGALLLVFTAPPPAENNPGSDMFCALVCECVNGKLWSSLFTGRFAILLHASEISLFIYRLPATSFLLFRKGMLSVSVSSALHLDK